MKRLMFALAAMCLSLPVEASGPSVRTVSAAFSGFYIGANVGGSIVTLDPSISVLEVDSLAATGATGGAQVGFDARFGPALMGVFASFNFSNTEFSVEPGILSLQMENDWRVGVRVGYVIHESLLLYVPVYYTEAKAKGNIVGIGFDVPTQMGWGTGLGAEYALDKKWSVGAQYTATFFDDQNVGPLKLETTEHRGLLTLNYRPFN